ncbi:MAG: agmatine deiminase family protein [Saprospiraceae bacterium]|nr:agmatine deiminase family protein [Saprospiraceae bacterium]
MKGVLITYASLMLCCLIPACRSPKTIQPDGKEMVYYNPANANRTAAEWEPALGTMIVWPLCIPHTLVIELARDNHLYTLVQNTTDQTEAITWYTKWDIPLDKTSFIIAPQGIDAWWTRDWGPSAVFTPEGTMFLGDGKYIYATPVSGLGCTDSLTFIYTDAKNNIIKTEIDDNATIPVGKGLNIPVLDLPFITTGGNVLTDGMGTAFSSCILLNENNYFNVSREQFFNLNESLLGFKTYHILSNFELTGIQHIDCFMKLLDEERILVAEPPKDHVLYPIYDRIVEHELKNLKTIYGRPYQIHRIKIGRYDNDALAAYTNSLILNTTIYVPLFQIPDDSLALQTWREVMPGYTVKGFKFSLNDEPLVSKALRDHYRHYGWNAGDALHCRTRAVWDNQMLYISVRRLPLQHAANQPMTVYATIIDYSKKGLIPDSILLHWRIKGDESWKEEMLHNAGHDMHFSATIPNQPPSKDIEYYISASSKSGRAEVMPRSAPRGFYSVKTKKPE